MINIEIYSKSYCPYCQRAKQLLTRKGLTYREYEITGDQDKRQEMIDRSSRTTVPQIFINDIHIGGGDDLMKAEAAGEIDQILDYVNEISVFA